MADVPLMNNPMTTAEDIIVGGTSGAPARKAVGSDGDVLTVTAGAVGWAAPAGGGGGFTEFDGIKDSAGGADINTTSTSFVDLTGASITQTTAAVRCIVNVSLMAIASNVGIEVCFDVDIDGTRYANTTKGIAYMVNAGQWHHIGFSFMTDVLTAASHTFKIQWRVSGNTGGVNHQSGNSPIIFQVIETTLAT